MIVLSGLTAHAVDWLALQEITNHTVHRSNPCEPIGLAT
jgi:hypothetical protein